MSRVVITGAAALALVAGGTAAGAAIAGPIDGSGAVHACYYPANNHGSSQVVLQNAGTTCPKGTTAISWNQTGPQGPQGAVGPQGPQGSQGAAGEAGPQGPAGNTGPAGPAGTGASVATEPPGSNCVNGGAKVTDGNGNTAYACTGATGPTGPAGTNGVSGYTMVTGPSQTLNGLNTADYFVACPTGMVPTGGGFESTGGIGSVNEDAPVQAGPGGGPTGWAVDLYNNTLSSTIVFLDVLCVNAS